jgi:type IV secretory pathway VirD2 relaxase
MMYSPNRITGQWRAHGRYIARESVKRGPEGSAYGNHAESVAPADVLDRWQRAGDPRLWKMIISPEFGERIDLDRLTRELMGRIEKDLGTRLEWVATSHFNTEHPHVHVALRGIKADGSPLDLKREYIRNGIRSIAEDLCTRQIGHRNQLDAMEAERREIQQSRYTSLDRMINRENAALQIDATDGGTHFVVSRDTSAVRGEFARIREHHIAARLIVLQKMDLAEEAASGEWLVRRDFEGVLLTMQRVGDRQKMLAAHGALLSDERLQLVVLDQRNFSSLEGRVLVHGEDEFGVDAGRHFVLIEGIDAKVHLVYYSPALENARSRGQLRPNSFVRLRKQFENGRPVLEVDDLADAEKILGNRRYLEETVRPLVKRGNVPAEDGWGGWLGRYQSALADAAISVERDSTKERRRKSPGTLATRSQRCHSSALR